MAALVSVLRGASFFVPVSSPARLVSPMRTTMPTRIMTTGVRRLIGPDASGCAGTVAGLSLISGMAYFPSPSR